MNRTARIRLLAALLGALAWLASPAAAPAQDDVARELRDSQQRLEGIRAERRQLEEQMRSLRSQVHDASTALTNVERQLAASAAVLREIELQRELLEEQVERTAAELADTRVLIDTRTEALHDRLRSIYKRGPLHTLRVLLGAETFADLLNRYKYLHLVASYDRTLIGEIRRLQASLVSRGQDLNRDLTYIQRLRDERLTEQARLRELEAQQERALVRYRQQERQAESRLEQLARDEAQLTRMLAELERRRREDERRRTATGAPIEAGGLLPPEIGALSWPVDGDLIYRFGPERRPSGVVLRWNGIGIAAPAGSPVRAVEGGTVAMAGPFEGYGPSVMISHGGGYYTVYLYLEGLRVRDGQSVAAGQVIGVVGSGRAPRGSHIEFQVWRPVDSLTPVPVDPLDWLSARGGS